MISQEINKMVMTTGDLNVDASVTEVNQPEEKQEDETKQRDALDALKVISLLCEAAINFREAKTDSTLPIDTAELKDIKYVADQVINAE